jgi:hypothetical protein
MHRTDVAVDGCEDRHVAVECFLDTKTLAMNRQEILPDPSLVKVFRHSDLT